MRRDVGIGVLAVGLLTVGLSAHGAIVVQDVWGGSSIENWAASTNSGTPGVGLSDTGALRLDGTGGAIPAEALVFIADNDWTGNYGSQTAQRSLNDASTGGGVLSVSFDFYSDSAAPGDLYVYFQGAGGSYNWFHSLAMPDAYSTHTYWVNFLVDDPNVGGNWFSLDGGGRFDQAELEADLQNVTRIGVAVTWPENTVAYYSIDNFTLYDNFYVPEPETYMALGFAFVSLGITFRRRLRDTLKGLLKR